MSEALGWGVLTVVALFLWLGSGILRYHLQWHAGVKMREMLYKERIAALNKGAGLPPDSPAMSAPAGWASHGANRFITAPASRILSLSGVVLFFLGIGVASAFGQSVLPELVKLWSLGLIPGSLGLGLLIYSWFVRK